MTVLVVGAGFAGLAAAWQLHQRGCAALLAWDADGASCLYSGALDWQEWHAAGAPAAVSSPVAAFLEALGVWAPLTSRFSRVASSAGVLRPARGRDRAVLDVELLRGRRVGVVDFERPGFDAASLSKSWSASSWAQRSKTRFVAVRVQPPDADRARRLGDVDLAECFDDADWQDALGERLRELPECDGWLFGPWLGLRAASVERLRKRVGRPLGETLSDPGGAAGCRFELARDAWLERASIPTWRGSVARVERAEGGVLALGAERFFGAPDAPDVPASAPIAAPFRAVVMAVGGLVSGGIRFLSGRPGPQGRTLSLSIDCPVSLRLGGREMALHAGAQGVDPQRLGLDAIRAAGLPVDAQQRVEAPGLFAAGDVVAARPRTALEAVRAGIEAGRAASAQESWQPEKGRIA